MSGPFTPGPWRYVRDGDYWEITPTQIGGKDNYEGNEADYQLIAAAPDLLAALQAWKAYAWGSGSSRELAKILAQADAAIAKATGTS